MNFLVTGQGGIENDFASGVAFGADRLAVEDRSIFQSQNRGYRHAGTPLEPLAARKQVWMGGVLSARSVHAQSGRSSCEHPPALRWPNPFRIRRQFCGARSGVSTKLLARFGEKFVGKF